MIRTAERGELIEVCERLRTDFPMVGGGLIDKRLDPDDPSWAYAQKALGYVASRSDDNLDSELDAFAAVSVDFLRLQSRFMKTGQYARAGGAEDLVEELYNDVEKMEGYYLDGLALTYALWPNHAHMIRFMSESFLPRLSPGARVAEVGVGHGLLSALMFEAEPDLHYVGVDISPSSLRYAERALVQIGVDGTRVSMVHADAMSGDLAKLGGDGGFDALVCCEVLEHVNAPDVMLRAFRDAVMAGTPGFFSTVANMEAEDHVYLYNDVDEIRQMLTDTGWAISEDAPKALPGGEDWTPLPVNYCGVVSAS